MSMGELLDLVERALGCDPADAFRVCKELYVEGREEYSEDVIRYAAAKLGVAGGGEDEAEVKTATPIPEITMDPAEVLQQVYLACPRCVPAGDDGKVNLPIIGRAPVEERHAINPDLLEQLPEEIKVLLLDLNVENAEVNVVLYDEANGVDRRMPPIDLTRFESGEALMEALEVLLKRLPRVLAADWN